METPFNFSDDDKPEVDSGGGGKLPEGKYNFEFVRVANADDGANDNGIVEGKNGWKALKLMFKILDINTKNDVILSKTFTCDYDPTMTTAKGDNKRSMMIDMAKQQYKALCHFTKADLKNTDSLIGRKVSCLCKSGQNDFLEMDCGFRGENWDEYTAPNTNGTKPPVQVKETSTDLDDEIPF
jgi:hypothetical protein